jgi:type VI protein secretion system component Hcp
MRRYHTYLTKLPLFALLASSALPHSLRADEKPIFGDLTGLACKGAADSAFPGFAVSSFSFGDTNVTSATTGSGVSVAKASFQDISVVKGLDDCTPLLFEAVAKGSHIATATLTVVSRNNKTPILVIQLADVVVTSDKFTEGAARELDEVITLSYAKITITHVPSSNKVTIDVATGTAQ